MAILGSGAVYSRLTEVDADGNVTAGLAESWEASPDAAVWTFQLRKGVEFHNGKPFTAEDVIASIDHHRGEDSKSPIKQIVDPILTMEAPDPHTVVITLDGGNADFAFLLFDYHLCMMPSDAIGQGIGTGGYMVDSFEPGVRAVAKRNPNYFKGDSRAHFDSIELINMVDPAARSNALLSGGVDFIAQADLKTLKRLSAAPGVVINEQPGTKHFMFQMITTQDPFTDNHVREALKYAVDRQSILDKVLVGHGQIGNDQPIGPANRYHDPNLAQRPYDPDKARFHLKKAGMEDLSVDLATSDGAFVGAVDMAVLFRESAAPAGINVEVDRVPGDGYWSDIWRKRAFCASYSSGRATEDWILSSSYLSGVPWNATQWGNEAFDKLLVAARTELDDAKRREMYGEMQRLISQDGGVIAPIFTNHVEAHNEKLAHDDVGTVMEMDSGLLIERWWFS
ncbi:ABC transporter substrate-binding protein [Roseovarius pelagicus]|uniref:ABC transporter substrate-binding protein n=1 Tax=Roseovarius pelagicus TaxID=2980108 RepID=A0ABY6D805_9RHOB|nr:ABC transporter substrate-binding protein [Roseovarius pelagicus]UXX81735.1 ABC transporter substrate-binding protein [Roseovarius pelagicus]